MKYAYKNGKILNGTKDMQVQTGLIILTEGEKIAAIVPEETRLSGYTEIDLQGKYIMPGLINMHVHLAGNGKPQKKPCGTALSRSRSLNSIRIPVCRIPTI